MLEIKDTKFIDLAYIYEIHRPCVHYEFARNSCCDDVSNAEIHQNIDMHTVMLKTLSDLVLA
jgi:hypothetical protein